MVKDGVYGQAPRQRFRCLGEVVNTRSGEVRGFHRFVPELPRLLVEAGGRVRVDVTSNPSDELEGGFEDEGEFVLDIDSELWLSGWEDADAVFVPERPGPHRVRVRARGRRDHPDESVVKKKPVEFYQLAIWPVE